MTVDLKAFKRFLFCDVFRKSLIVPFGSEECFNICMPTKFIKIKLNETDKYVMETYRGKGHHLHECAFSFAQFARMNGLRTSFKIGTDYVVVQLLNMVTFNIFQIFI